MIKPNIKYGLITGVGFFVFAFVMNIAYAQAIKSKPRNDIANVTLKLQNWLNNNVNNHPKVLAAKAAADSAAFQLSAAGKALYNPNLDIDAETAASDKTSIGLSQTIDWGDTRHARTEMARSLKSASEYAYEATRRDVATALINALSQYRTTLALKILAKHGNTLMQHSAKLAKQRFDTGDLKKVDIDLANLTYAQARFKLAAAITLNARAIQNLIAMTGHKNTDLPHMPAWLSASGMINSKMSENDINVIVEQLPNMREIILNVQAARENVKVQSGKSAVNPTVAFRAGKENKDSLIGLNLSLPLQIRNNFQAEIDAAKAKMIQVERRATDAKRKIKSRLKVAIISYRLSRDAWLIWQKSGADTLSTQIKLLERLWITGEINTTDYLVQLKQALETKAKAIEQRGRMWTDWSEWLIASGKIKDLLTTNTGNNNEY